jgi:hypothetical protein
MLRTGSVATCMLLSSGAAFSQSIRQEEFCKLEHGYKDAESRSVTAAKSEQNPINKQTLTQEVSGLYKKNVEEREKLLWYRTGQGGTLWPR